MLSAYKLVRELDLSYPGWESEVCLRRLDSRCPFSSVYGQLFGAGFDPADYPYDDDEIRRVVRSRRP